MASPFKDPGSLATYQVLRIPSGVVTGGLGVCQAGAQG
jgi:hypothetical protein